MITLNDLPEEICESLKISKKRAGNSCFAFIRLYCLVHAEHRKILEHDSEYQRLLQDVIPITNLVPDL